MYLYLQRAAAGKRVADNTASGLWLYACARWSGRWKAVRIHSYTQVPGVVFTVAAEHVGSAPLVPGTKSLHKTQLKGSRMSLSPSAPVSLTYWSCYVMLCYVVLPFRHGSKLMFAKRFPHQNCVRFHCLTHRATCLAHHFTVLTLFAGMIHKVSSCDREILDFSLSSYIP